MRRFWPADPAKKAATRIGVVAIGAALLVLFTLVILPNAVLEMDLGDKKELLSPAELAKATNDVRTTLLQALAGLVLIAGAVATWKTLQLSRESQVTDRFSRAIDQLGQRDKLDVRVGGIHSLDRIARDSRYDRAAVLEVLAAFLRENARRAESPEAASKRRKEMRPWLPNWESAPARPADYDAAVTVLVRRNDADDPVELDLRNVDLAWTKLDGARLGRANLMFADLFKSRLLGADLRSADLTRANLQGADLSDANLDGAKLFEADLGGAILNGASFRGANLGSAKLVAADATGADFRGAYLLDTDMRANYLNKAQLGGATAFSGNEALWNINAKSMGVKFIEPR